MKWRSWPALRPEERAAASEREQVLLALVRAGVLECVGGRIVPDSEWPLRVTLPLREFGRAERPQRCRSTGRLRLVLGLALLAVMTLLRGDRDGRH